MTLDCCSSRYSLLAARSEHKTQGYPVSTEEDYRQRMVGNRGPALAQSVQGNNLTEDWIREVHASEQHFWVQTQAPGHTRG